MRDGNSLLSAAVLSAALALPVVAQVTPADPPSVDASGADIEPLGQRHGVIIGKTCLSPMKVGDTVSCDITVGYNDDFGDTLQIVEVFDVVDPGGNATRVPAVGNLDIIAVVGNTTAVVGGALPVNIGPGGSTLSGLPGDPFPGIVVFRQNSYVIQPGDPDPLPDRASVIVQDLCDHPDTQGCSMIPNLVQFTAATDIIFPGIDIDKTADPTSLCPGVPTEVLYTYVVTNAGDSALENVVLDDTDCGPIVGPVSGDIDDDGVMDLAEQFIDLNGNMVWDPGEPIINDNGNGVWDDVEVWTFECTAVLDAELTNTVTVTANALGVPECIVNAEDTATVTELPVPEADPQPASASACEGDVAEICSNPSGGVAPYTFSWTGPGGFVADTECITVGVAGTYCVTVTDANGCVSPEACAELILDPPPPCSIVADTPVCQGEAGTVSGPPGLLYQWSVLGGCGVIVGPDDVQMITIQYTTPGACTVQLTVTDPATGCVNTCETDVDVVEGPIANPPNAAICAGAPARICVDAGGGTPPYTYAWTGPGGFVSSDECIDADVPGEYCVVVTDANGCVSAGACATLSVDDLPPCSITAPSTICAGGTGVFSGPAGPGLGYQWSTDCGAVLGSSTDQAVSIDFGAAGACTVSLTTTDLVSGCTSTCEIPVTVNENPLANPPDVEVCIGDSGEICANASGGAGPYTYEWTGPGGFTSTDECITVGAAGTYCVLVTDANGCVSAEACGTLTVDPLPPCDITAPGGSICANGTGTFTGPAGPGLAYQWSTDCGSIVGSSTSQAVTIDFGAAGVCSVHLTTTDLATGCTNQCTIPVTINENPEANPPDVEVCLGDAGEICANASDGTGPYTYAWTGPGGFTSTDECITVSDAGTYCVVVTDANGCASAQACGTLTVDPLPVCTIDGPIFVDPGTTNTYTGPAGMASYQWAIVGNGTIVGPDDQQSVDVLAGDPPPASYTLTLDIVDANGCASDCGPGLTVTINVVGRCCLPGPSGPACLDTEDAAGCAAFGGTGFTAGETCDTLPCGACCLNDPIGACIDRVSPDECAAQGGDPATYTPNAFCSDIVCSGACCFIDGTCQVVRNEAECDALPDSVGFLPGVDCIPNPCVIDEPGWNYVDNVITLTGDQPTYWSVLAGLPAAGGVAPFTALDPGFPPGRPAMDGTTDRVLRGYVLAWAVNSVGDNEIEWNELKGEGTVINYRDGYAWEYNTWNFRADTAGVTAHGGELPGSGGFLFTDTTGYECAPAYLLINFQAVGAAAFSGPRQLISGTDLTLHPVTADLRQEGNGPITTEANFDIWNMNKVKFSETHRCITCWDQTELDLYGIPNSFTLERLQTAYGKARIDGLESEVCDVDVDPGDGPLGAHPDDVVSERAALLGVIRRLLTIDGGAAYAAAGTNPVAFGYEDATIWYDPTSPPPEDGADGGGADGNGCTSGDFTELASATQPGSLVVFSNVEIRWSANGFLIQDTFLSLTNDHPGDVKVQLYFINGDPPINGASPADGGAGLEQLLEVLGSFDPDEDQSVIRRRLNTVIEQLGAR